MGEKMESRVAFLEQFLTHLGFNKALEALDWVMEEMNASRGFTRHNGTHYYYHLVDTTQDLLNHNVRDEDIIVACLLHDIVEDVEGITIKLVEHKFGERVAEMVDLLTKKPNVDYKDALVLGLYLSNIYNNVGASLIKTADRKHNFGTLRDATPEKKVRQAMETELYFIPFFKDCRKKYPRYASYFYSAKTTIEPHLWEIKEHYEEVEKLKQKIKDLGGTV